VSVESYHFHSGSTMIPGILTRAERLVERPASPACPHPKFLRPSRRGMPDASMQVLKMGNMIDLNPYPLSKEDWRQIVAVPAVSCRLGLDGDWIRTNLQGLCTALGFKFVSGSPWLRRRTLICGDSRRRRSPMVLRRGRMEFCSV